MNHPTLLQLLHRSVRSNPQAEAIIHLRGDSARRVTYSALWEGVREAERSLRAHRVSTGERVALVMENSPEYVMAYYGALARGAVVVPLNRESKAPDLASWIKHSGARLVWIDTNHSERSALAELLGRSAIVVSVGDGTFSPIDSSGQLEAAGARPDDLAAILYTSGATGDPKGVMLSQENLASNTISIVEYLGLTARDRAMNLLPFFYSYGNSVLHSHLAAGASLVLGESLLYPQRVIDAMAREKVTGFPGVPWMYSMLMSRTRFNAALVPSLRYLTQAGAAMAADEIEKVKDAFPLCRFYAMYGQTEATARIAYLPPEEADLRPGSVGKAIPGVSFEIRRVDGSIADACEHGEVFVTGPNIMLGYWNSIEATRAVIREDARGRYLATGDVGRLDLDGYLYLVGRNSEMIKTSAHRVSPHEIEEAVGRLEGVDEVAAFGVPDPMFGQVIKVMIVRRRGAEISEMEVLSHCRRHLSSYKIPRHVDFIASLPKTASGKIRRRFLAEQPRSGGVA